MKNKIKDKIVGKVVKEYRVFAAYNDATGKDMYYLSDDSSAYKFGSYNFGFIRQFAERLRSSGHKIIYEESVAKLIYRDCNHSYSQACSGCVLDTGDGCLYDPTVDDPAEATVNTDEEDEDGI